MIYDEKPGFPEMGRPGIFIAKGKNASVPWLWNCMKHSFLKTKGRCLEKILAADGTGRMRYSGVFGAGALSSGRMPGGRNKAVAGMMAGAGISGPDQATDMWSGPPSSL